VASAVGHPLHPLGPVSWFASFLSHAVARLSGRHHPQAAFDLALVDLAQSIPWQSISRIFRNRALGDRSLAGDPGSLFPSGCERFLNLNRKIDQRRARFDDDMSK
jgi:hypothetical protein